MVRRSFIVAILALVSALSVVSAPSAAAQQFDQTVRGEMRWRNIGPHRASRTKAVAGVPSQPHVFYIGVVNGGVWKTTDAGHTWSPIFDDQPTGSIGAVAVAPSDPNVVYVGSGEGLQRPDLSTGDGFYRSNDAGKTWTHLGLRDAQQITEILVDPINPNRVFVAVLGHPYGPNEERGVYRSTDGGRNFQRVLYKDENTGASDLVFDPKDPNTLYAALWQARQGPWENGAWNGPNSGLFKSTDGGTTWNQLTKGLPTFEADGLGRIGVGVAPSDPKRLYAIVEARGASGGIYRSDDAGENWTKTAADTRVWTRPTDASEIVVDPRNADVVYSVTIVTWKSTDGGKTWTGFKGAPGGDDYQKAWFNPVNPDIMIMTSDQGAVVTLNGGQTWSSWYNQPTAQFYHVTTDNAFPYRVCSGQQESGSACVQSRGDHGQITFREWSPVGASEYSYVAPDPLDPDIVYGGTVNRFDRRTGQTQNVSPHPIRPADFRTLRTAPILFSPVDPRTLYFAGNTLWKTTNGGTSWTRISPDLTRTDSIVPPSVGVYSNTPTARARHPGVIYTVAPSYKSVNTIWAGTDDGLIHVTHDGGRTWKNVTPPDLKPWAKVSLMDASHTDSLSAYAAVNTFRLDELKPHIYRTRDGGKTWTHITKGIPDGWTVNVVREDPRRKGLLFAGTEQTVYVSIDDGDSWRSLRLNLPPTSIRDLVIKDDDIVVGTHGRSFWILDDITPLRQIADSLADGDILFRPQLATRFRWNKNTDTPLPPEEPAGQNPPDGAIIDYYLKNGASGSVVLEISDSAGAVIRRYNSDDTPEAPVDGRNFPDYWLRPQLRLSREAGMHRFVWDLRHAPPSVLAFTYPISATYRNTPRTPLGTWVMAGRYTAKLTLNRKTYTQPFNVRMDPRVKTPPAGLRQQYALSMSMYRLLERNLQAVREVRAMRQNLRMLAQRAGAGAVADSINALERRAAVLEGAAGGGPGGGGGGDGERSLSQFNGNLASIYGILQAADVAPTTQVVGAVQELERAAPLIVTRWETMKTRDVPALNAVLAGANLPSLDPAQWR